MRAIAMPIKTVEILHLASKLSKQENEVAHRSAVSRAYYAAYHHGIKVVERKLPSTKSSAYKGGCHQQLLQKFFDGKSLTWQSIALQFNDLKKRRVVADYYLNKSVSMKQAEQSVVTARQIIDALDAA